MIKIKWLEIAQRLQSISQAGLEYSKDVYDIERFQEIRDISAEIMSEHTEYEKDKIHELFANEKGYQTPKIDVRASVIKDNKILLVHEKINNKWALPGGWAEINISLSENVKKESLEEAGAVVEPQEIIAIYNMQEHVDIPYPYTVYKIFVQCEYIKGEFVENLETKDAQFFSFDNLPELATSKNTIKQIKRCFDYYNSDSKNVYFD